MTVFAVNDPRTMDIFDCIHIDSPQTVCIN